MTYAARCARCGGRYGIVPVASGQPTPLLCTCPDREPEIIAVAIDSEPHAREIAALTAAVAAVVARVAALESRPATKNAR